MKELAKTEEGQARIAAAEAAIRQHEAEPAPRLGRALTFEEEARRAGGTDAAAGGHVLSILKNWSYERTDGQMNGRMKE